ncbi:MAG: hypothetical protein P8N02_17235 [Actinomycetota bacterium]|nr:hypothetical protein [Actinomycetota bacterium]
MGAAEVGGAVVSGVTVVSGAMVVSLAIVVGGVTVVSGAIVVSLATVVSGATVVPGAVVVVVDASVEIVSSSPLLMIRKIARAASAPMPSAIAPGMSHAGRSEPGFVGGTGGTGGRFPVLAQRSGSPSFPWSVMRKV